MPSRHRLVVFCLFGLLGTSSLAEAQAVLQARWEFDGNYEASNDSGWNGVPNGSPTFVPGVRGQAVALSGGIGSCCYDPTIEFVESMNTFPSSDYAGGFSVMGWIRIEGPSISGDLFSHDSSSCPTSPCTNDRFGFSFQITNGDQLDLVVRDMSDRRWIVQTTVPRPEMIGQWTHVAATYNGSASPSGIAIYVNGDLASTTVIYNTGFTVLNGSTPLALRIGATQGSRGNIIQGIDGQIDHASFWRGALTASQIAADYASTAPMQTASEAIYALIGQVLALNLKKGITNSLDSKLSAAVNALDDANQHNDVAAVNALQAFINAVQAQIGGALSPGEAASLIASAQAIIERLA